MACMGATNGIDHPEVSCCRTSYSWACQKKLVRRHQERRWKWQKINPFQRLFINRRLGWHSQCITAHKLTLHQETYTEKNTTAQKHQECYTDAPILLTFSCTAWGISDCRFQYLPACWKSKLFNFPLCANLVVALSSNAANSVSISVTTDFSTMFKLTLPHRGQCKNWVSRYMKMKRWGFMVCRDAAEGKWGVLGFLLLSILSPTCKEQKTQSEKPHRKPN